MNTSFLTYRTFNDPALLKELMSILDAQSIPYQVEDTAGSFDVTFSNSLIKECFLKLQGEDFDKVNSLLNTLAIEQVGLIEEDHYLFSFSDDELIDLLKKKDEWNELDAVLAERILNKRGRIIDIKQINNERKVELSATREFSLLWIVLGYISLLVMPIVSAFIGWVLFAHKKTLPNGDRINAYTISNQKHGKALLILGVLAVLASVIMRLYGIMLLPY